MSPATKYIHQLYHGGIWETTYKESEVHKFNGHKFHELYWGLKEEYEDTKGIIRNRKSKKDRQHSGQKKDRQHSGQKKDRQHSGQKKDRQHSGQKKDRQHSGQKKDRQHSGQKNKNNKGTNNNLKNLTQKTKDRAHKPQFKVSLYNTTYKPYVSVKIFK